MNRASLQKKHSIPSLAVLSLVLLGGTVPSLSYADTDSSSAASSSASESTMQAPVIDQEAAQNDATAHLNEMSDAMNSAAAATTGDYAANALNAASDDSAMVQNAYSSEKWNDANNSWGTTVTSQNGSTLSVAGGCDPEISRQLFNNQLQEIAGASKLAAQIIKRPQQDAFSSLVNKGCIPGFGGILSLPSLASLASIPEQLAKQVCQAARSMETNFMNQYITSPMSRFYANANPSLGSIGGYSLGSVPLGVQTSTSVTTGGSGGLVSVSSNADDIVNNLTGQTANTMASMRAAANNASGQFSARSLVKNGLMSFLKK